MMSKQHHVRHGAGARRRRARPTHHASRGRRGGGGGASSELGGTFRRLWGRPGFNNGSNTGFTTAGSTPSFQLELGHIRGPEPVGNRRRLYSPAVCTRRRDTSRPSRLPGATARGYYPSAPSARTDRASSSSDRPLERRGDGSHALAGSGHQSTVRAAAHRRYGAPDVRGRSVPGQPARAEQDDP